MGASASHLEPQKLRVSLKIKQCMPIYQASKLLGHVSVTTTEKHYAPLLATDVEEFVL